MFHTIYHLHSLYIYLSNMYVMCGQAALTRFTTHTEYTSEGPPMAEYFTFQALRELLVGGRDVCICL